MWLWMAQFLTSMIILLKATAMPRVAIQRAAQRCLVIASNCVGQFRQSQNGYHMQATIDLGDLGAIELPKKRFKRG